MIPGLKSKTYEKRLEHLGLWSLEERRSRADLLEVFKMHKGLSLLTFSQFFTLSTVTTTHGHTHTAKIAKTHCQLDLRRFFFPERVVDKWNGLHQSIIDSTSISCFKNGLEHTRATQMGFFTD